MSAERRCSFAERAWRPLERAYETTPRGLSMFWLWCVGFQCSLLGFGGFAWILNAATGMGWLQAIVCALLLEMTSIRAARSAGDFMRSQPLTSEEGRPKVRCPSCR